MRGERDFGCTVALACLHWSKHSDGAQSTHPGLPLPTLWFPSTGFLLVCMLAQAHCWRTELLRSTSARTQEGTVEMTWCARTSCGPLGVS